MVAFDPVPTRADAQLDRLDTRLDSFDERLRAVELSCARLEGKVDMMLRFGHMRPARGWQVLLVIVAVAIATLGFWIVVHATIQHG